MSKRTIILITIAIAIFLFATPFFLRKETNESIVSGVNLISGIASFLTLLIALLLYNKFGIETSLLEKQTKQVFELLENLNNYSVLLQGKDVFMTLNPAKPYRKFYEEYYERKLVFSVKYIEGLQHIWKHVDNVFLPKEIANKLSLLQVYLISNLKEEIEDNQLKVSAPFAMDEVEKFGEGNDKNTNLMTFISDWVDLIEEIKKWIRNNSSMNSELNLD